MLKGKLVKLAPIKKEYIDQYVEWLNDPEITQYLTIFRPLTLEMEKEWINNLKNRENDFLFAILLAENEKLIGNCGIQNISWKDRFGGCGIFIGDKNFHGKGYGTEALQLLIQYGFFVLNLNRIELTVLVYNVRAIKSYKKVGFVEEGRKGQAVFKNGNYHDLLIMAILKSDWKEMNE